MPPAHLTTITRAAVAALALLAAGCGTKPGVIFPPLADAPAWPPPPA